MKNVLFIVYYFPPMGGSGVQRPLKFAKYLREFGWNPIVLCPEPGMYPYFDETLEKELGDISLEIHRINPDTFFHSGLGDSSAKEKKIPEVFSKMVRRALRLFMYPDNKKGWIQPAIEKGEELLKEKDIRLIFSTAPPFSNHVIGRELKSISNLPLVLDYRDAWIHNHFFDHMFGWQKKIHKKMEASCIENADALISLDTFMLNTTKSQYKNIDFDSKLMQVLPHGYDPEDFKFSIKPSLDYQSGKLNFLYSGLFYESNQPDIFLDAIALAEKKGCLDLNKVHLHFQGNFDKRIKNLIKQKDLSKMVTEYGYIPHKQAVANLIKADVLWMISNFDKQHKQVKSGKLFEYFAAKKPILGIVNEGVEADLLREYNAGYIGSINKTENLANTLGTIFKKWEKGQLPEPDLNFIKKYNRKELTKKLAAIFDKISTQ